MAVVRASRSSGLDDYTKAVVLSAAEILAGKGQVRLTAEMVLRALAGEHRKMLQHDLPQHAAPVAVDVLRTALESCGFSIVAEDPAPTAAETAAPSDAAPGASVHALFAAIKAGDVDAVQRIVAADRSCLDSFDPTNDRRCSPLYAAVLARDAAMVHRLLQLGAAVATQASDGDTPLHMAAFCSPEVAEALLAHGAEVNARNEKGGTPLHVAARGGSNDQSLAICKLLLDRGADVRAVDAGGHSALWYALAPMFFSVEVAKLLIDRGADVTSRDAGNGETTILALMLASRQATPRERTGAVDILRRLAARGADLDASYTKADVRGLGPLAWAVGLPDCAPFLEPLLELGADPAKALAYAEEAGQPPEVVMPLEALVASRQGAPAVPATEPPASRRARPPPVAQAAPGGARAQEQAAPASATSAPSAADRVATAGSPRRRSSGLNLAIGAGVVAAVVAAFWLGGRSGGERNRVRQVQTPAPSSQAVHPGVSDAQPQAYHGTQPEPPPPVATPPALLRATPGVRVIRSDLVFRPEPAGPLASVIANLSPPADAVGAPVSADEFRRLLDDPRAEVYWSELLKYASPQSRKIQKQEHKSFIPIFMKPAKIAAGVAFLSDHATELAAAQARYGVPAKDIVSVLMWESNLGKSTGKFRVANIYLGQLLYLDEAAAEAERTSAVRLDAADRDRHVKRLGRIKRNAEKYLVALLRSCKAKGVDPFSILGSWGGAIGFPQFMPTSFQYAVDGNGDGQIDLYAFPDAIASIGNYLSEHGYGASRAKAIHSYNPEDEYVRGVQMYADAITRGGRGR